MDISGIQVLLPQLRKKSNFRGNSITFLAFYTGGGFQQYWSTWTSKPTRATPCWTEFFELLDHIQKTVSNEIWGSRLIWTSLSPSSCPRASNHWWPSGGVFQSWSGRIIIQGNKILILQLWNCWIRPRLMSIFFGSGLLCRSNKTHVTHYKLLREEVGGDKGGKGKWVLESMMFEWYRLSVLGWIGEVVGSLASTHINVTVLSH